MFAHRLHSHWVSFAFKIPLFDLHIAKPLYIGINLSKAPVEYRVIHRLVEWVIALKRLLRQLINLCLGRFVFLVGTRTLGIHFAHKRIALCFRHLGQLCHISLNVSQQCPHTFSHMRTDIAMIADALYRSTTHCQEICHRICHNRVIGMTDVHRFKRIWVVGLNHYRLATTRRAWLVSQQPQ